MAMQSARYAAEVIDEGLREGDLGAARLARYEERALVGADLFRHLVREFYGENLREVLFASATNPTVCAIIASILAGDVYEKALWQTLVRPGFSRQLAAAARSQEPRAANSRQTRTPKQDL
jgi:flavin-dependent dehydrogenase